MKNITYTYEQMDKILDMLMSDDEESCNLGRILMKEPGAKTDVVYAWFNHFIRVFQIYVEDLKCPRYDLYIKNVSFSKLRRIESLEALSKILDRFYRHYLPISSPQSVVQVLSRLDIILQPLIKFKIVSPLIKRFHATCSKYGYGSYQR